MYQDLTFHLVLCKSEISSDISNFRSVNEHTILSTFFYGHFILILEKQKSLSVPG